MRRANMPDSTFDCFCSNCLSVGTNLDCGFSPMKPHAKPTAPLLESGDGMEAQWEAAWIDLGGEG